MLDDTVFTRLKRLCFSITRMMARTSTEREREWSSRENIGSARNNPIDYFFLHDGKGIVVCRFWRREKGLDWRGWKWWRKILPAGSTLFIHISVLYMHKVASLLDERLIDRIEILKMRLLFFFFLKRFLNCCTCCILLKSFDLFFFLKVYFYFLILIKFQDAIYKC